MATRSFTRKGAPVGLTYIPVTVESLSASGRPIDARFLVDTGAVDCLLPAALLHAAGVESDATDVYELADGRTLELRVGWARLRFMDTVAIAKVAFGPDETEPILGVIAMETAGVTVDPLTNTLRRLTKRSLKKVA
jgi:clan AA aspartic protease